MSTTETIMEKASGLSLEKQERVLEFVRSIIESGKPDAESGKSYGWMETAPKANLQGPPDWTEHRDDFLYGGKRNARRVALCRFSLSPKPV
jgi:hypothetical protein